MKGDRNPSVIGTSFLVVRQALLFLLALAIIYVLVSVGVAVSTADKCGSNRLDNQKEWDYMPPHWRCVAP